MREVRRSRENDNLFDPRMLKKNLYLTCNDFYGDHFLLLNSIFMNKSLS